MPILVTGSTGKIGSGVVKHLVAEGADVLALTRNPGRATFPAGVEVVQGDLLDVDAMRSAIGRASSLFLLSPVTADELTRTLLVLNLAREAGIERLVYLSVFQGEAFANVPHFTAKHSVELAIEQFDIAATILRPNCLMQNDTWFKDDLLTKGVYPFPIGNMGVSMVDVRDVAEVAARTLLERERSAEPLPHRIFNIVGPEALTGDEIAAIWSALVGRPIRYGGNDTSAFESQMRGHGPSWAAMDLRLMLQRFQQDSMRASRDDVREMSDILGRYPRPYATFAAEAFLLWKEQRSAGVWH